MKSEMMLRSPAQGHHLAAVEGIQAADHQHHLDTPPARRKRKAESQDNNERLTKRLSLLNIEHTGQKLYVPVENPKAPPPSPATPSSFRRRTQLPDDDSMQLDDSSHKVYVYNIDDELSSESEAEDGKLVFLGDIEKHLRNNRIPRGVLANKDGELAGMQMVLYTEPTSLTVPKEQDNVRKAIIEARARVREKQREERAGGPALWLPTPSEAVRASALLLRRNGANSMAPGSNSIIRENLRPSEPDPDAMDLD